MKCNYFGFVINQDSDGNIQKVLERKDVAAGNLRKAVLLVYELNHNLSEVINSANSILKDKSIVLNGIEDLAKLNSNRLAKVLNTYYRIIAKDVHETQTVRGSGNLGFFKDVKVRTLAQNYVSNQILNIIDVATDKLTDEAILNELLSAVRYEVSRRFNNLIKSNLEVIKNANENSDLSKKYYKVRLLLRELQNIRPEYKELEDKYKSKKITEEELERVEFLNALMTSYRHIIFESIGSEKDCNYLDMYIELSTNTNEFIKSSLLNNSQCSRIKFKYDKLFSGDIDIDKLNKMEVDITEDEQETGEEGLSEDNGWDKNSIPSTFDKLINAKFKLQLARVPKLKSAWIYKTELNSDEKRAVDNPNADNYDTENELGVVTYVDGEKTLNNLIKYVDNLTYYETVDSLINRIQEISLTIPELYGLGMIVEKMINDPIYANFIYTQLRNNHIKKEILYYNLNNADISQNNIKSFEGIESFVLFRDYLRKSFTNVSSSLIKDVNNIISNLNNIIDASNKKESVASAKKIIKNVFRTIYPKYSNIVDNYEAKDVDKLLTILNSLKIILDTCTSEISKRNDDVSTNVIQTKYINDLGLTVTKTRTDWTKINSIDYMDVNNMPKIIQAINNIIRVTTENSTETIDLNSVNAEGNTSSNFIANSWISRLFEFIKKVVNLLKMKMVKKY